MISTAILWLSLSFQIFDPCGSVVAEWRQQVAALKKPIYKIPRGETATDISKPPEPQKKRTGFRIPKNEAATDISKT